MSAAFEAERVATQGNPNTTQQDVLSQLKLHRYYAPIYEAFVKVKERAIKYLTTYVDPRWQYVLSGRPTLHDKISSLEANVAPSHESRRNALRLKFATMQKGKSPNASMTTYLHS